MSTRSATTSPASKRTYTSLDWMLCCSNSVGIWVFSPCLTCGQATQSSSEGNGLLGRSKNGRKVNSIFGEGVNPLMRKVREFVGLPSAAFLNHGNKRILLRPSTLATLFPRRRLRGGGVARTDRNRVL